MLVYQRVMFMWPILCEYHLRTGNALDGCGSPILPDNGMENCQQAWRNTTTPLEKHLADYRGIQVHCPILRGKSGEIGLQCEGCDKGFFPTLPSCFYIYHLHLLQTSTKRLPKVNRSVVCQVSNQSHPGDVMHLRKLKSKYVQVILSHTFEKS
jgi:hypothetical protein